MKLSQGMHYLETPINKFNGSLFVLIYD